MNVTEPTVEASVSGSPTSSRTWRAISSWPVPSVAMRPDFPLPQLVDPEAQMLIGASTSPMTSTWPTSPKPLTIAQPEARVATTPTTDAAAASRIHLVRPDTATPASATKARRFSHPRPAAVTCPSEGAGRYLTRVPRRTKLRPSARITTR